MKENTYSLVQDLIALQSRLSMLEEQIEILHRYVNTEEIRRADRGYSTSSIYTEDIRRIFDWSVCNHAKNAKIEREAKKAAEQCETNG